MCTNIKLWNGKELWLKILVHLEHTHTDIDKQLVKKERIKITPLPRLFNNFNTTKTRSRNHRVTQFAPLELETNRYTENIDVVVIDLNYMDIFLGYNWLVKHNPLEANWNKEKIYKIPKEIQDTALKYFFQI